MLKRGTKSEYTLLASSFSVNVLGFSPLGILLAVVLLYIACIMLRYILCMSRFSSTFTIKKKTGFCQKPFLNQHEYSVISVLQSAYVVGYSQSFISSSLYHLDDYLIIVDDTLEVSLYLVSYWRNICQNIF